MTRARTLAMLATTPQRVLPVDAMDEIEFPDTPPAQVDEIPAELPVLPLKETVAFPDSMTPLAIGKSARSNSWTMSWAASDCSPWSPRATRRSRRRAGTTCIGVFDAAFSSNGSATNGRVRATSAKG